MTATTIHPHRPATAPRRGLTTALVALLAVALGLVALPARDALAAVGSRPCRRCSTPGTASRRGSRTPAGPGSRRASTRPTPGAWSSPTPGTTRPGRRSSRPTSPRKFFYLVADSQRLTTGGCSGTKRGNASVRLALEGAFANGAPRPRRADGVRPGAPVRQHGLCANGTYTATTPFGAISFRTDARGRPGPQPGTTDVDASRSPRPRATGAWPSRAPWPAASSAGPLPPPSRPAAPAGYLGDAVTAHRVVGATYTAPGRASPANYFSIVGTKLTTPLRTDLFTVAGKVAGPLESPRAAVHRRLDGGRPVVLGAGVTVRTWRPGHHAEQRHGHRGRRG